MSKSEKRHFKLDVSKDLAGKESIYLELFDLLDKQQTHDEVKLLKKAPHIKPSRLPNLKSYLKGLIMKSLRSYHSDTYHEVKMNQLLHNIHILNSKAHYKECAKEVARLRNMAEKYEALPILLEVMTWERRLTYHFTKAKKVSEKLEASMFEQEQVLEAMQLAHDVNTCFYEIYQLYLSHGTVRNAEQRQRLKNILNHPVYKEPFELFPFKAQLAYVNSFVICFEALNEPENAYPYREQLVRLFEDRPEKILQDPQNYVTAMNNLMIGQKALFKYDVFFDTVQRMRQVPDMLKADQSANVEVLIFSRTYLAELGVHNTTGDFNRGLQLVQEIRTGLNRFEGKISTLHMLALHNQLAYVHFGAGKYREALRWINESLNTPEFDMRIDMQSFMRMLNLLIHFELGNYNYLEYVTQSSASFLYKLEAMGEIEKEIIQFIEKTWPKLSSKTEQRTAFRTLSDRIVALSEDEFEKQALYFLDLISWTESKARGEDFADVVTKRFRTSRLKGELQEQVS